MKSYVRKRYKLPELFEMYMGKTPDRNNPEYWENGTHPWISIADMTSNGKFITQTKECITDKAIRETGIKPINYNTVIMSFKLSVGKVSKVATAITPAYSNEAIMTFEIPSVPVGSPMILSDYAYYLLQSLDFTNAGNKAVMGKTLNKAILQNTTVNVHMDLEVQSEIIAVLDKVTALIDKREEQFELLEDLIKARFVELFGNLGGNDKKWDEIPLGSVCEQVKRYPTFCNMEYLEKGTRVIRIGNILLDGHMDINDENYVFVYEDVNDDYPDSVIEKNDIVMAVRGDGSAAKRIGIITEEKLIGSNISPNLIRIKANKKSVLPLFLFHYLTSEVGQKRLDSYVNKTAKKNIAAKDIVKVLTPVPPLELQAEYCAFVEQTNKTKLGIQKSLEQLETLKKALMQKYFG